jgi:hypothetical protein
MDKIPEERAGTVVRAMYKIPEEMAGTVVKAMYKIPEEMAGTVARCPWIKTTRDGWHCGVGAIDKIP